MVFRDIQGDCRNNSSSSSAFSSSSPKIIIAAGGSGGHIIPAQVVAKELREKGYNVHFAASGLSSNRFFGKHEFSYTDIRSSPFSLKSPFQIFDFVKNLAAGTKDGYRLLQEFDPQLVIGFGSYHTVSILSASWMKKIPIILHEANAHPGHVIQLFAPCAEFIGCYFPGIEKKFSYGTTKCVDIPIRREITASLQMDKKIALDRYGFSPNIPTFLVVGGSQGAKSINNIIPDALIHTAHAIHAHTQQQKRIQVLHISGGQDEATRLKEYYRMHKESISATVIPYEMHMEYAYKTCDIVIARSGASTIAELSFLKIPTLFIPYPHAKKNHQLLNAQASLDLKESLGRVLLEEECMMKGGSKKVSDMLFQLFIEKDQEEYKRVTIQRSSFIDEVEKIVQRKAYIP